MDCKGIAGKLLGHAYRARFDTRPSATKVGGLVFADEIVQVLRASEVRTYRGDVCVRCGHVLTFPAP